MKCVVCRAGETRPGTATVTLEPEDATVVVKGVPAQVCANCGEQYLDEATTAHLLRAARDAARSGVKFQVREYLAA